ncbi:hypothetical protein D3C78_1800340 [compost metagenome]
MAQRPYPLLQTHGFNDFPGYNDSVMPFKDCELALTELGKSVLAGNEDWVQKKGIDEWYGGVHLQGSTPRWRWNSSSQTIQ